MSGSTTLRLLFGMILLSLVACAAGESREPTKVVDEIPDGPGLFSGEDGEFVIYRR
ncbi:MAG: hypothetical protein OEU92_00700 [Alphaproteobacteria bacterium]|nr:hypothetical protein [Alphaproteobacteria bacterium]